jgi:hypothetical protein
MPSFTKKVMEDRDSEQSPGREKTLEKMARTDQRKRDSIIPVERIRSGRYQ